MRSRFVALLALGAMVFTVVAPAAASAVTLQQQPQEIKRLTFEPSTPTFSSNSAIVMPDEDPPAAYWGAVSGIKATGSYSWWCAGTTYPTGVSRSFGTTYPVGTRGLSTLRLPELANYYSSTASFAYLMPSLGGADDYSFSVSRQAMDAAGNPIGPMASDPYIPLASTWTQRSYDLAGNGGLSLSRKPAQISFQFFDYAEFPGAPNPGGDPIPPQTANGQGAAIDDLVISGFKYGPIRSLTATRSGNNVVLNWRAPATSMVNSADDTRTIGYRVWRSPDTDPTNWTEVTTSRGTSRTFTDSSAAAGGAVHYFVQAWDPTAGGNPDCYGDPSGSSIGIAAVPDNTKPVTTISTLPTGWATANVGFSLTATDEAWNTLTSQYRLNGGAVVSGPSPLSGVVSAEGTTTITYHSVDQAGNTETDKSAIVKIDKTAPVTTAQVNIGTNDTAIVNLTPLDNASGVAHTYFKDGLLGAQQEGRSVPLSGVHDIYYWSVDVAGNIESPQKRIHVDPSVPPIPSGTSRVGGVPPTTRIDTAVLTSQKAFPNSGMANAVVVANGYVWTDALPATALAATVHGPLLLAHNTFLDQATADEIRRLGVSTVYIAGNTTNINDTVRASIQALGVTVVRVTPGGGDVYATSRDTALKVQQQGGATSGIVFISRSDVFADSLAASSLAANKMAPIILVPGPTGTQSVPPASIQALQQINPSTVVICGSTMAVTDAMKNAIHNAVPGANIVRKDGSSLGASRTRFDTARDLIEYGTNPIPSGLGLNSSPDGIYIARGDDAGGGADALAAGVLAGASYDGIWRPMMTTAPTALSGQASAYMDSHVTIRWARVMGSTLAVNATVAGQVGQHLH